MTSTPGQPPQPWMTNRPGESNEERAARLEHTCYRCGWECRDSPVLDLHQDVCDGTILTAPDGGINTMKEK